jgi:uncharacterized peroxidase-related enzyme
MVFSKSLSKDAVLLDVFKAYPETSRPLIDYHETLLRGPSPLSVAERELIAAFVSTLNACSYCTGVHEATARALDVDAEMLAALTNDVDESTVDGRLKPILHYVKKLTLTPSRLTESDAEAVFAAGWDDRALHDAVSVCALFNFMNRLVEGLGITADQAYFDLAASRLSKHGYAGLNRLLESE